MARAYAYDDADECEADDESGEVCVGYWWGERVSGVSWWGRVGSESWGEAKGWERNKSEEMVQRLVYRASISV